MNPNQPNAFERSLPDIGGTAGSIIGGILGGGTGAVGGAAIPGADLTGAPEVAGGVLGYKAGSTLGAGVGGSLGQAAEDFATHKLNMSAIPGIALSGLENAGGNLLGLGLNKIAGSVLGGAKNMLTHAAEGRAAQAEEQAASQEAANASKAAADRAATYKNNYGSISQRMQTDLNLGTNAKFADRLGFDSTDPGQLKTASNGGLELNTIYDKALQGSKPVDISQEVLGPIKQAVKNKQPLDSANIPLRNALQEANIPLDESTLKSLPATQVRQLQQAVGREINNSQKVVNNAELQGMHNTEEEANLKNLHGLYDQIGAKIKTPEVDQAVAGTKVNDSGRAALVEKYGEQMGNHLADTVNNAKSADDLLKPMQQFKQMSTASDMALNDIENAIGTPRAVARTQAANPTPEKPAGNNTMGSAITAAELLGAPLTHGLSLIPLAAQTAGKAMSNPDIQDATLSALQKVTGNKTAQNVASAITRAGGIAGTNLLNEQPTPAGSAIPGTPGASMVQPGQGTSTLGQTYQQEAADQNAMMRMAAEVPGYLGGTGYASAAGNLGGVVAGLAPQVQKQEMAGEALSGLMPAFQQAGGAQGPLGGLLSEATSVIPGSAAQQYQHEQATAAATLASLLGISPAEAQGLIPRLTQTPGTAATPTAQTGSVLNQLTLPQLSLGQ